MHTHSGESASGGRWYRLVDVVANAATVLASATLVWALSDNPPSGPTQTAAAAAKAEALTLQREVIDVTAGHSDKGDVNAPLVAVLYADFHCRYCGVLARDTLPLLEEAYVATGKVRIQFRHLADSRGQPARLQAAIAAECAGNQGAFWRMHDALFAAPRESLQRREALISLAGEKSLNTDLFLGCLDGEKAAERVQSDTATAIALGIAGTPALLIATVETGHTVGRVQRVISGAKPFEEFVAALDSVLRLQ